MTASQALTCCLHHWPKLVPYKPNGRWKKIFQVSPSQYSSHPSTFKFKTLMAFGIGALSSIWAHFNNKPQVILKISVIYLNLDHLEPRWARLNQLICHTNVWDGPAHKYAKYVGWQVSMQVHTCCFQESK